MVEGILIFSEHVCGEFDVKVFVDTDSDLRFIRRLERDILNVVGRPNWSSNNIWPQSGRMHQEFVEPSKRYADVIVPEGGLNTVAMEMVVARLEALVRGKN